jgi:hypothetical protein
MPADEHFAAALDSGTIASLWANALTTDAHAAQAQDKLRDALAGYREVQALADAARIRLLVSRFTA